MKKKGLETKKLLLVAVTAALMGSANASFAGPTSDFIRDARNGNFDYLTERGDIWGKWLTLINGNCGKSKADGEYRFRRLARQTEALVKAAKGGRPIATQNAARNLRGEIGKSDMYGSCWKTMKKQQAILAAFDGRTILIINEDF